jgi:hypothetical protein
LPDGLFSNQKSPFGYILENLGKEDVVIFYDHLECLLPFGIIYCRLVQFVVIWYIFSVLVSLDQEKSGNPGVGRQIFLKCVVTASGDAARMSQCLEKAEHSVRKIFVRANKFVRKIMFEKSLCKKTLFKKTLC